MPDFTLAPEAVPPAGPPMLVPHLILEQYARGQAGGRFSAASLFADIAGFSAVTNVLLAQGSEAAESLAEIMLAIFDPLVQCIYAHGGMITTFAGDAFTALFPNEAFEDEEAAYRHALAAALRIQEYMAAHADRETPYGAFPFAIKLGLAGGEVEWGILKPAAGAEGTARAAYFFSGPAVDRAAAAEHNAGSGDLILDAGAHAVLAPMLDAGPAGEDGAVRVQTVHGALPDPRPVEQGSPHAEHMAAFLPDAICRPDCRGEFRQVISVFIKLMGIHSAEELSIFMQSVFSLQRQYGGYLNRVDFGDKGCNLLMFWGAPRSFENDVERALDFVLEIPNITPGTFKAGLTYAPMYAGLAGSPTRGEFTCYGVGVNFAARLMMAAPWGSLWLDQALAQRASRRFRVELAGRYPFKGFAEEQPVYALLERKEAGEAVFTGRLVGRQAELARLGTFAEPLAAGRFAGVLMVQGEAGMGKSRLVHEFQARLNHGPADSLPPTCNLQPATCNCQFFVCQANQTLRQPLHPFRYWLRRFMEQSAAQSEERNKRAFSRKMDRVIAATPDAELQKELDRTRSFLGALVGLFWENSLYAQVDPQGRFENTMAALKTLLKAESLQRPVVLVVEDVQWLDEDSIEFLRRLVRNVEDYPLAVLATARPAGAGAPLPGVDCQVLELAPLTSAELGLFAADVLGAPAGAELLELLAARAGGNPFLAEQILLYLREQGAIALGQEMWQLAGTALGGALPADVRAIFNARLDHLAPEVRDVVQTAAVLGREFELSLLGRMLPGDAALSSKVAAAEQEQVWVAPDLSRCLFKHALMRDAAYEMQLRARRRGLHLLAGEALESLHADDRSPYYPELAHHYETACVQGLRKAQGKALEYLERAGRRAAEAYENAAAVDYFSRALALTPATDIERRFELLLAREQIVHLLGQREQQRQDLEELAALAVAPLAVTWPAAVALRRAIFAEAVGDYPAAAAAAQEAVAQGRQFGDGRTMAAGHIAWGTALWRQGQHKAAREQLNRGLEEARAAGDRPREAEALKTLGSVAGHQGDFAGVIAHCQQALPIYQEVGDRRGEGIALNNIGLAGHYLGRYDEAQTTLEQALGIQREIGNRREEGRVLNNLGVVCDALGRYAEAESYYRQALYLCREIGDRDGEGKALNNLGYIWGLLGDYGEALTSYQQALAIRRAIGDRPGEGVTLGNLGKTLSTLGDYPQAQDYFRQALNIYQDIGDRRGEAVILNNLGAAALPLGHLPQAQAYLDQSLAARIETGDRRGEGVTRHNLGQIALHMGQPAQAAVDLRAALALRREMGAPHYAAEDLAALARAALAQGRRDQALAYTEEVLEYLAEHPTMAGAESPYRAMLSCYDVLQAHQDPRARPFLEAVDRQLREQAGRISDPALRRSFLEQVPEHRALVELAREAGYVEAGPALVAEEAPVEEESRQAAAPAAEVPAPSVKGRPARKKKKGKQRRPQVVIVLGDVHGDIEADVVVVIGDWLSGSGDR